jgi:hypothetical protein
MMHVVTRGPHKGFVDTLGKQTNKAKALPKLAAERPVPPPQGRLSAPSCRAALLVYSR